MARGKSVGRHHPSRSGDEGGDDDSSRWLATYGDAVTLLMAFFVMLYAMSEVDVQKFREFVRGLEAPFGNASYRDTSLLPEQGGIVGDGGFALQMPEELPTMTTAPTREPELEPSTPPTEEPTDEVSEPSEDVSETGGDEPPPPGELASVAEQVRQALAAAGLDGLAELRFDERGLIVSIATDDVLFATGDSRISPLGERIVGTVAAALRGATNDLLIEGHTDNVPLRRNGETNWNLSADRALEVLNLMYQRFGIAQQRLGASGYGEWRPLAPNDTPSGRARNRRVDIVVVQEGAGDV